MNGTRRVTALTLLLVMLITPALASAPPGHHTPDCPTPLTDHRLGIPSDQIGSIISTTGSRSHWTAPPPPFYPYPTQLTDNANTDRHPQIYNGQVTWEYWDGSDWEIFFWNGSSTIRLTNKAYDDMEPQIHNGQVTWYGSDGDYEVYVWDGLTTTKLTNNAQPDKNPQIHNGQVTWYGHDGNDYEIYLWNGTHTTQLTNNSYSDYYPQIHNGQVTWWGGLSIIDWEIFFWNGSSTTQLTNNAYDDWDPQIHNGQVTWYGHDGNDYEVFVWDGSTTTQLTSNAYDDWLPQIHGGQVTWYGHDGNDFEIFLWDGATTTQLTDNTYHDRNPQVHNGQVTWTGYDSSDAEVFVWDGSTTTQLTNNAYQELEPQIHDGQVTWWGRYGDYEIFLLYIPPTWIISPTDQIIEYGEALDYQVVVAQASRISYWTTNDTVNFALSGSQEEWGSIARITNATTLALGTYGLNVTAYDLNGHTVSGVFSVTVVDRTPPAWGIPAGDQTIEFGTSFSYTLSATDTFGLDHWAVNDSVHFAISIGGIVTNNTALSVGVYGLRITVNDTHNNWLSGTFSVHVQDTTSPRWVATPTDQVAEYCSGFSYDVDASDLSAIDHYWVNDTTTFAISGAGLITNASSLPVGTYWIEVRAYDPYSNYCTITIKVTVQDTTSPVWVTTPANQTLVYREPLDLQMAASDHSGIAQWSVNDTTHFAIDGSGRLTSLGTLPVGSYSLNVTVVDSYGNGQSVTFRVTVVPAVTSIISFLPVVVAGLIVVCIVGLAFVLCEVRRKS